MLTRKCETISEYSDLNALTRLLAARERHVYGVVVEIMRMRMVSFSSVVHVTM